MADVSEWRKDTSPEWATVPQGRMAQLREIARTGEPQVIDDLIVSARLAETILSVYAGLTSHEQEVLAEDCNADFCTCVYRCMVLQTALPFACLVLFVPQDSKPTSTGTLWG